MSKPIAIAISDIHFNLNTLLLASAALEAALIKAQDLSLPLVIAGDLNDTKAIIRGEVANKIIEILNKYNTVEVFILEGNHDKLNEKGKEHGLNYLRPYATIIDEISFHKELNLLFIPYQNDSDVLKWFLKGHEPVIAIMHQGFLGAQMGDYVQDKTSISPDLVKNMTVISGHYHRHQTLGTVTYIGSPYTITFGEANDGPKGFLIVNEDGTFTREILNLRRHRILELTTDQVTHYPKVEFNPGDLLWLKIKGPYSELKRLDKKDLGEKLFGHCNFKLDLIPNDSKKLEATTELMTDVEILDKLIDAENETNEQKLYLKGLHRELIESESY